MAPLGSEDAHTLTQMILLPQDSFCLAEIGHCVTRVDSVVSALLGNVAPEFHFFPDEI
jgi:hypothetical protein